MSALITNPIIQQGAQGEFYEVGGIKYTGTFPYEWAIDHKKHACNENHGSGPEFCGNCLNYGSINGVFVCYCDSCLNEIYNDVMYPKRNGSVYTTDFATDKELWEACPYMKGIPRSKIGDKVAGAEEEERYQARLREQEEEEARYQAQLREEQEQEDYYEAYRDNDDYYDQWDEPYSREYPITRRELARVPADMRAAFDPEYQESLANFRAAASEENKQSKIKA